MISAALMKAIYGRRETLASLAVSRRELDPEISISSPTFSARFFVR